MDRAGRRARGRRGDSPAAARAGAPSSSRARRRGEGPVVVIDLGDDDDDERGGGRGREAAGGAAGRRGGSAAAASPPRSATPPPMMVPAGAVAMRTRSRRRAMEAAVAAPEEPGAKRRRKGASSDVAEAPGGRGSKAAGASRSTPRDKRRGCGRNRSRRASEPASTARARKRRGKESEAETEVEAPARGERVNVSRGNESDDDGGRRDDASDGGNGEARTGSATDKKGNRDRRRATGGDEILEPCVAREVTALDLNHRTDEVVSGDAEEVEGAGDEGGGRDDGSIVDENTRDSGNREQAPIVNVVAEEMAPFEDDYDDEMLEEQLVGDVIRAYSNGEDLDADGVDWEAEDEMEFDDEEQLVGDVIRGYSNGGDSDADGVDWEAEDEMEFDDEEQLVGDVIRGYSNGGDSDADGVDWEAEDEMEFDDDADDGDFMDDADEGGMTEPIQDHDKMEMQDLVNHNVVLSEGRCQEAEAEAEEEAGIKDEVEPKGEAAPGSSQQGLHVEILDSDEEEVKVLENVSSAPSRKASVQAKLPTIPSCVAWRTRSSWGMIQDRLSYNTYFDALSDEPKEEEDDTEVELDEEDNNDDDSSETSDEDEEEEEEEEEAERRKLKNRIYTSDDDMIDTTVPTSRYEDTTVPTSRYDIEWEEDEDASVDISQPISFRKATRWNPVAVGNGNDTFTEQQKQSRFTWELERRKKVKLGMKTHPLYERDLDSDSSSSGSDQIKRYGFKDGEHKVGRKKKHPSSKSGKKSGHATMLKRQSLLKFLIDKMSGDKNGETFPFDQNPQLQFIFKEMHPLVFSFGDEDLVPADKPEQDGALDMLWADFDFALESENIGTYYDDEGQEEGNQLDFALAPVTPCSRGKHEFIIDDQIGIRCKYCSLVNLEIKFMFPSLVSGFAEKSAWPNAKGVKNALMFHGLYEEADSGTEHSQDFHLYGTVWDLIPGVISTMYEHQREAFEFMWTNLVGDIRLDELKHGAKPDVVGGCVICHAPGTGKTRLAIVYIQTYMKVFPDCRPVIIAPRGMLFAWDEEFKKWNIDVPFHIMNTTDYTGKEDRDICKLVKKEHRTEKLTRLVKLLSWNKGHGILGISYGLYTKLTSEKPGCTEENKVRSILLENPGLLVLDEGHTPRNDRSVMWKTLGKVKTEKRIILSGTPFQNNFLELYNILCLVRPRFGEMFLTKARVGRRHYVSKKQKDKFSDKYEKGVWASLTSNVIDDNAEKVRSILKPFVHIHNGNILRTLPGLRESVIILKPLPLQKSIIRKVENIGSGNNFEHEYVISLASTHPSLVTAINMSEEEASLIDKSMLQRLRSNPYEGVKTRFVIEVVRLCEALREKVLIFSQFIQPLELIKEHLRKFFKWREGKEILQMDGKILPRYRQASIEAFNNPNNDSRVLLASTRACCEGISLTGASRVVLLDVVWNPAVGRQAISRAFRIGQKKFVYTYNLITYGTGEGDKYDRQAEKDHLSKLVFSTEDEFNNVRNMLSKAEMEHCSKLISEDKVLEEMTSHDQLKGMFLKIHYPPTESNIVYTYNQIAPA
ncbi:hypothetical protein C2845_PM06G22750 [Panicum miliaceum]|uniref:SNF2 domain-containing protein CLASSY 3-like n=1 Tax=Panicum miliaceum TaxID=4540 RepID=A0A3L6RC81_PANMI|nr:hypothetical protein C2845_PM06G22750 [Panicum miliaceum]